MSDWQVGDLALRDVDNCPYEHHDSGHEPTSNGVLYVVVHVATWWDGRPVIYFDPIDRYGVRCGGCFRKIRPDEREACEPEFVKLLKRSKRKVPAQPLREPS